MSDIALAAAAPTIALPNAPAPLVQDQTANAAINNPNVYRVLWQEAGTNPQGVQAVASELWNRKQQYGQDYGALISAPNQYGPGSPAGSLEHTQWLHAAKLAPDDPALARVADIADPILTGQEPPIHPFLQHYSPSAQQAAGRAAPPSWAQGPGVNYAGNLFYTAASHAVSQPETTGLPDPGDVNAALAAKYGPGATAQNAAPTTATTTAPESSDEMPAQADIDAALAAKYGSPNKGGGTNVRPPAPPTTPAQQAATRSAAQDVASGNMPGELNTYANAALGGLGPVIYGGGAAALTAGRNALAGLGIGPRLPFGASEAYGAYRTAEQAQLDAYAKTNPVGALASNALGFISPGGVADVASNLITHGIEHLAPAVATRAATRFGTRAAGLGAAGGATGLGTGLSRGESMQGALGDAATQAALTASLGGAGELAGGVLGRVAPALPRVARALGGAALGGTAAAGIGAAGGAGVAAAEGHDVGAGAEAGAAELAPWGAMAGAGKGFAVRAAEGVVPSAGERQAALDAVAGSSGHAATANSLEGSAIPGQTTAEVLGPASTSLVKEVTKGGPGAVAPIHAAVDARSDPVATVGRTSARIQQITNTDPVTSQMDQADHIEQAKLTTAKPAWDAVDQSAPTHNSQIATLMQEPEVRSAVNWASKKIGSAAFVDNPAVQNANAQTTSDGRPIITAQDYQAWLNGSPNPDPAALVHNPTAQPVKVPTAETLILAQRDLANSVARDPITRQPLADRVANGNSYALHWAGQLNDAIKQAIPGLAEAKAASGDVISNEDAYASGRKLSVNGTNAETSAAFAKRYAGLSPAEQQATQRGYMADMYRNMERAQTFSPAKYQSPFHQAVQGTMFGSDAASQMQKAFQDEAGLTASGQALKAQAKPVLPPEEHGVGSIAMGALTGGAESGGHPAGIIKGALAGFGIKSATGALQQAVTSRGAGYRQALGEILAQPPEQTATQLRARYAQKQEVPLSQSTLGRQFMGSALRGVALTTAHSLQGAR